MTTPEEGPERTDLEQRLRLLRMLRRLGLMEGATLVFLICIAVPMKHWAGVPGFVSAAGPTHGLIFLLYLWLAIRVSVAEGWERRETVRLCGVAIVPFGTFFNDSFLRRKLDALGDPA
ncbi:DUF3817 domain-containing protein [Variovorax sp. 770b2]|uniref:DUF3817 domain-containing protein n=1 Tax=Variovorax sp. 770b2 TaxID=1566271 RepID=UPI0008F3AD5F|nr:DUF3817 domain-containing protein [Variovorax sp. 770b2]SFQ32810.1 integral membrane protein [Variovorax sp. 770b2]